MKFQKLWFMGLSALALLVFPITAGAATGQPTKWAIGLQDSASPIMQSIIDLHTTVLYIIIAISVFVFSLLAYVLIRFRASRNPKPSKTTHNQPLEIIWTLVPTIILIAMLMPSWRLLYNTDTIPSADMTIKATGYTWYWHYEYPDYGELNFDANIIDDDDLAEGQPRLLTTDETVVVPVGKNIRVLVTSDPGGVIHSWAVPALGVKVDAVPGRLNETWFRAVKEGTYYGQCSELCGFNHAYMPITIKAVSDKGFKEWLQYYKSKEALEVLGQ